MTDEGQGSEEDMGHEPIVVGDERGNMGTLVADRVWPRP